MHNFSINVTQWNIWVIIVYLSVLSLVKTIHKIINHYYVHRFYGVSVSVFIKILEDRKSFEIVLYNLSLYNIYDFQGINILNS